MRWLTAAVAALIMVGFYVAVIWGFFAFVWPALPPWAAMLFFIALAVFGIGSPIWWLARWSDRAVVPSMRHDRHRNGGGQR